MASALRDEPPRYLTSALLDLEKLPHLFTTRHFPGVTPASDRTSLFGAEAAALLARRGLDGGGPAYARQVHGALVVRAAGSGLAGTADALVSERPGLALAVFTADCLPIVIYDPVGRRLAVAHAGWRGTVKSVAVAAVRALVEAGGRPETFVAAVGPSIGPCCYEVDRPVIDRLAEALPTAWEAWVTPRSREAAGQERWMLDLWKANEAQLHSAGLHPSRIDNPRLCTSCRLDLFYSYRRGARGGRLVTMAAVPD